MGGPHHWEETQKEYQAFTENPAKSAAWNLGTWGFSGSGHSTDPAWMGSAFHTKNSDALQLAVTNALVRARHWFWIRTVCIWCLKKFQTWEGLALIVDSQTLHFVFEKTYICMCAHAHIHMGAYISTCVHTCVFIYLCLYDYIHMHMCIRMHTCAYMCT